MATAATADRASTSGEAVATGRVPLHLWTVGAILAPGLVVFVLPMASLIARNDEYFGGRYGAGRSLYLLGLGLVAVGVGLWAASASRVGRLAFVTFVLLTPAWLVYSALGDVGRRTLAAVAGAAVVGGGAFALLRWGSDRALRMVSLFCTIALLAGMLSTGIEISQADDSSATDVSGTGAEGSSRGPNVYHLVLDEFQTDLFEAVLTPEVRADLGGFTWFTDARTPYGRTQMSMASLLAPEDYGYDVPPGEWMEEARSGPDAAPAVLREAGYRTEAAFHSREMYGDPHPFDVATVAAEDTELTIERDDTALARSLWFYSNLPGRLAERLMPERHFEQLSGDTLLPDDAPALSVLALRSFLDQEAERPDHGRYALVHLIVPHFPHVLTPDCEWEPGVETDALAQSACGVTLLHELLAELERLDRFDAATIVIQGDHGGEYRPVGDGGVREIRGSFYSEEWSEARSRALLLVKPAGRSDDEPLRTSDYPALLTDVMPTIFDSIDLDAPVGEGRTSLLDPDPPARAVRWYHFYDEGPDNVPDGWLERYTIDESGLRHDRRIDLP